MIDIELLSKAASGEDVTGKKFFEKCRRLAAIDVARDFVTTFVGGVEFDSVLESDILGSHNPSCEVYTECGEGYFVKKIYADCIDPFVAVQLDYIELYAKESACITVCVNDGCKNHEYKVNVSCGVNRIDIRKTGRIFHIYVPKCVEWLESDTGCNCECDCNFCYATIDYESENKDESDLICTSKRPMVVAVSCICLQDEIVCRYADQLANAMRWKTAATIYDFVSVSRRDNPVVRSSKDDAKDKVAMIMSGGDSEGNIVERKESKYWPELYSVQKQVKRSMQKSRCISCRGSKVASAI